MKWIVVLINLLFFTGVFSQTTEHINNKVKVIKHADIDYLINKQKEINKEKSTTEGFRIQIASTNDRSEAYKLKSEVYQNYAKFKTYLVYEQPYYKLRVGDFLSNLEALQYLEEINEVYPAAWIVPDNVKLKN